MPDNYGDYRDTQRRWMHRPAPAAPLGWESRMFAEGQEHDPADGWTHDPNDAIARSRLGITVTADTPPADVVGPGGNNAIVEDDGESIPLEVQVAALKRPALLRMAAELGIQYDTGWTAAQLRAAILTANG